MWKEILVPSRRRKDQNEGPLLRKTNIDRTEATARTRQSDVGNRAKTKKSVSAASNELWETLPRKVWPIDPDASQTIRTWKSVTSSRISTTARRSWTQDENIRLGRSIFTFRSRRMSQRALQSTTAEQTWSIRSHSNLRKTPSRRSNSCLRSPLLSQTCQATNWRCVVYWVNENTIVTGPAWPNNVQAPWCLFESRWALKAVCRLRFTQDNLW
jgi:hypothetical protein